MFVKVTREDCMIKRLSRKVIKLIYENPFYLSIGQKLKMSYQFKRAI